MNIAPASTREHLSFRALHDATSNLLPQDQGHIDPNARVGIRYGSNGAVQVYQRTNDLGFIARFRQRLSGGDPLQRELLHALKAVARDQSVWHDPATGETALDLLKAIRNSKGGINLMQLHSSLQVLAQARPAEDRPAEGIEPTGSLVARSLGSLEFRAAAMDLAHALKTGDKKTIDRLAGELGSMFAADIGNASKETQMHFAVADGARFRADVKAALLSVIAADDLKALMKADVSDKRAAPLAAFMADVFMRTQGNLPNRATDVQVKRNDKGVVTRQDIKSMVIDGHTWVQEKQLAEGGFGTVALFRRADAPHEKVVVKIPIPNSDKTADDLLAEGRKEVIGQIGATRGDAANVIGIQGAIRLPAGGVAIVQDFANNGDVDDFWHKLGEAQGNMTPADALNVRLTVFKDMLDGLSQMQANNVSHLDLKGANIFIQDGQAKIGDFGTSATQERRRMHDGSNQIDNPLWRYPLLHSMIEAVKSERDKAAAPLEKQKKAAIQERNVAKEVVTGLKKKITTLGEQQTGLAQQPQSKQRDEAMAQIAEEIAQFETQLTLTKTRHDALVDEIAGVKADLDRLDQALTATGTFDYDISGFAADNWSVAITAYELFTGKNPFAKDDTGFKSVVAERATEFMKLDEAAKREYLFGDVSDAIMPPEVKDTIWKMMSFYGNVHHTPGELASASIFQQPDVGSPATRALVSQVAARPMPGQQA